jgi:hypothetical protein
MHAALLHLKGNYTMNAQTLETAGLLSELGELVTTLIGSTPDEATDLLTNNAEHFEELAARATEAARTSSEAPAPAIEGAHTPGPWEVIATEYSNDRFSVKVISNLSVVATCEARGQYEAEANARLIASAPELLAALQGLMRDMKAADVLHYGTYAESVADARAAIAKAGGAL